MHQFMDTFCYCKIMLNDIISRQCLIVCQNNTT